MEADCKRSNLYPDSCWSGCAVSRQRYRHVVSAGLPRPGGFRGGEDSRKGGCRVRQLQKRPGALAWADGPEYLNNPIVSQRFPLCELRGCRIVDELPRGCPLATDNPTAAIGWLEDRGWQRELRRPFPDIAGGQIDRQRAGVCSACSDHIRVNPVVRRLRALLGVAV